MLYKYNTVVSFSFSFFLLFSFTSFIFLKKTMDFGEVGNHIDNLIERESQVSPVEPISTTYDSLIHQPVVRKPTFSNFVHRLKQHSSKTRFVREYKKMAHTGSDGIASDDDMYSAEDNGISTGQTWIHSLGAHSLLFFSFSVYSYHRPKSIFST